MIAHRTQRRLVAALLAEAVRVRRGMADDIAHLPGDMQKAMVAQNVLRTCMEAAANDAIPFGRLFPGELAIRLASYAISILPEAEQADAVEAVVAGLPAAHSHRMAQGVAIKSDWATVQ